MGRSWGNKADTLTMEEFTHAVSSFLNPNGFFMNSFDYGLYVR